MLQISATILITSILVYSTYVNLKDRKNIKKINQLREKINTQLSLRFNVIEKMIEDSHISGIDYRATILSEIAKLRANSFFGSNQEQFQACIINENKISQLIEHLSQKNDSKNTLKQVEHHLSQLQKEEKELLLLIDSYNHVVKNYTKKRKKLLIKPFCKKIKNIPLWE